MSLLFTIGWLACVVARRSCRPSGRIFPGADIPWFQSRRRLEAIRQHRITTSWIQKLPRASQYYSHYLPLFPFAIEQFDLSGYDLVVSSDAVVSKGVITRPETCHICYCHTPMRYAWSAYHTYLRVSKVREATTGAFLNELSARLGSGFSVQGGLFRG